jgi:hypothetical protein
MLPTSLDLNDYTHKETSKLYDVAIKTIRKQLLKGKTFNEAIHSLNPIDNALRTIIIDDFLKNIIVDQHFNKGRGLDDLALILDVSYEKLIFCRENIIEELELHTGEKDFEFDEPSQLTH